MSNLNSWEGAFGAAGDMVARADPWLAMLAHELREPLNLVVLALDELGEACGDGTAARDARDAAARGSRHMAHVIHDVLELSRGVRGQLSLSTEWVDLADVVGCAVEVVRPLMSLHRHELTIGLPPEPVLLDAQPSRLQQVLVNLLANAARYTPPGGRVALDVEPEAWMLALRVRDNGIGIAPERLPHLFDPCRRVVGQAHRPHEGLGIGLALVKLLVELHQGTVSAASEGVGRGSEFTVRLPRHRQGSFPAIGPFGHMPT